MPSVNTANPSPPVERKLFTVTRTRASGASGRPVTRELANGWSYRFSSWIAYTADRRPFEGVGLAPDVVARPVAGDAARGVDRALETALAYLRSITP